MEVKIEEILKTKQPTEYKKLCILKMSLVIKATVNPAIKHLSLIAKEAAKGIKAVFEQFRENYRKLALAETKQAMEKSKEEVQQ
jgi:ribosomal protein S8E